LTRACPAPTVSPELHLWTPPLGGSTANEGNCMNKRNLVEAVAQATRDSKAGAARAVNAVLAAIRGGLEEDGHVLLAGFGTFTAKTQAARRGRNPRSGEAIEIPPSVSIRFRPSPDWRQSLARARGTGAASPAPESPRHDD